MADSDRLYAVALTFSGEIEQELARLRAGFRRYIDYSIVPHITLVYPFSPVNGIDSITGKLDAVAGKTGPFRLFLNGIKYFEGANNVAYVAVETEGPVKRLFLELAESLMNDVRDRYGYGFSNFDSYIPHVTIGEHIPDEILADVKREFSGRDISFEYNIDRFSLFSEGNGVYERIRDFELGSGGD